MYVDALYNKNKDIVYVVERSIDGERIYKEYPADYTFYYDDTRGEYTTLLGTKVSKVTPKSNKEFLKEKSIHGNKRLWESDVNLAFRCLSTHYLNSENPKLHTAFFDIETDFHKELGYAEPEDPFNPITAISVYLDWLETLFTLVVPPKTLTSEQAEIIANKFDNTILFSNDRDMLEFFIELIQDADVLTGWNSELYDIPYTVNRIIRVLGKADAKRMCLWGQDPQARTFENYGAEKQTYDLVGRVHLDYMKLYEKYTYEERHSYSLNAIGEYEGVGQKVDYEGSLDKLYNQDFEKFILYSREDVMLMVRLDKKLQFIDLVNSIAHDNTVTFKATMGAVAVTDQAILNEAHNLGLIVFDRKKDQGETAAAGAWVANPKKGLHDWIGLIDINSLYPSLIRSLNMSPETIIGQVRLELTSKYITEQMTVHKKKRPQAWEGVFSTLEYKAISERCVDTVLHIDWEDGNVTTHTAAEIYHMIYNSDCGWVLSANGTIFRTDVIGVIPSLLSRWYHERQELQAKMKAATDPKEITHWDKRQHVKKINLNSVYGALLNAGCRFFDQRLGQSTTLSGRTVTCHMASYTNELIAGVYDFKGDAVIYGDTDSVMFSAWPMIKNDVQSGKMPWSVETCIELYDAIGENVNESFPEFMKRAFNTSEEQGAIIKCGREIVGIRGLYIKKKRYAILVVDKDGKRKDTDGKPGAMKAMGLDLRRSDTLPIVQTFLSEILMDLLTNKTREDIVKKIRAFKHEFNALKPWQKGTPKRVNNLTHYTDLYEKGNHNRFPGHVLAAIHWNNIKRMKNDVHTPKVVDGMKTIYCKLKPNPIGYDNVAVPIDINEMNLPDWFIKLPFDETTMTEANVDKKIDNLLGVLKWDLDEDTNIKSNFSKFFTVE